MTDSVDVTSLIECTVEVALVPPAVVDVQQEAIAAVELLPPQPAEVNLNLTGIGIRGPIGPVGPPGPNEIGGFPVAVTDAKENDTLLLKSWAWQNTPQEALTDGGNF